MGRGPECEVRVANAYLSRVHFTIVVKDDQFAVQPMHRHTAHSSGSGGVLGTFVNDEHALAARPIGAGDRISPAPDPLPQRPVFTIGETVNPVPPGTQLPAPANKGCLASLFGL